MFAKLPKNNVKVTQYRPNIFTALKRGSDFKIVKILKKDRYNKKKSVFDLQPKQIYNVFL